MRDRYFAIRKDGYAAGLLGLTDNPYRRGYLRSIWAKANRAALKRRKIERKNLPVYAK